MPGLFAFSNEYRKMIAAALNESSEYIHNYNETNPFILVSLSFPIHPENICMKMIHSSFVMTSQESVMAVTSHLPHKTVVKEIVWTQFFLGRLKHRKEYRR